MQNRIAYQEIYDYSRLEKAAWNLHLQQTEDTEIELLNLHNHLIWHSFRPGDSAVADAILSFVLKKLLRENNLDVESVPVELRALASFVEEGGES